MPDIACHRNSSTISIWLLLAREPQAPWVGLLTALAFVPSVGPHKFWTDPAVVALAPLTIVSTLCAATAFVTLGRAVFGRGVRGG